MSEVQDYREGKVNISNSDSSIYFTNGSQSSEVYPLLVQKKSKFDKPLICFCVVNFLLNAAVSIITPFYPPLAEKAGFSVATISYIFAVQPVGSFFFSFVIGSKMDSWGRKRCMIIGLIFQFIAITSFGFLDLIKDDYWLLLGLSLGIRFVQGVSRAAYSAISFAYIPMIWPDSIQQKLSIMESLTGLGLMAGPFIGAGLFYLVGYSWVFFIMGFLFSLSLVPSFFIFPNDVKVPKGSRQTFEGSSVYKNKNIILLALVVTMTSAGTTFLNPMFSLHMATYGIDEGEASLMLGSMTIVYVVFINFIPMLCRHLDKKLILTMGILISGMGDLIMAPLNVIPNEWWTVLIALPIIGIANAMCVLPSIPQFMDYIANMFPNPEHKRQVSDMSSGLFVGSYSFGIIVGPIIGGQVYDYFVDGDSKETRQSAFMWSSITIAGLQFTLAIVFFFFAGAFQGLLKCKHKSVEIVTQSPKGSFKNLSSDNEVQTDSDNQSTLLDKRRRSEF